MSILNDDIKTEIVLRLACFGSPAEIAREIQAEFEVKVDRFQVRTYDPTKPAFAAGDKWRAMFEHARARCLTEVQSVPIASKAYRLNQLQQVYDRSRKAGNLILANQTLRQAAEEMGNSYTNENKLTVRSPVAEMSVDERRAALTDLIRKALANAPPSMLPQGKVASDGRSSASKLSGRC